MGVLTEKSQCVRVNAAVSSPTITDTDAPQGSVLSPVLLTLYTHKCRAGSSDVFSVKFTDDMVIVALQELWSEGHRCLSGQQLQNPLVDARSEGYRQAEAGGFPGLGVCGTT